MALILAAGCATNRAPAWRPDRWMGEAAPSEDAQLRLNRLEAYAREWKGTPHVMGGDSEQGIDCSAFVRRLGVDVLDIWLPRTSRQQALTGWRVDPHDLRAGDLVFFASGGETINHVGVYLRDGRFVHASSSLGVAISHLDERYWAAHFREARRVVVD